MIFTCSWDDGHPLDLKLAELLARRNLRGTFFVPGHNIEGRPVLDAAQLRSLHAGGFEIGSHTREHRYLDTLSLADGLRQVSDGHDHVQQAIGAGCAGFCYPGGRRARITAPMLRNLGIGYARTIENLRFDRAFTPYRVPTSLQFHPHGRGVLLRNALRQPNQLATKLRALARLPVQASSGGVPAFASGLGFLPPQADVLHLWGHSWEIEEQGLWNALAAFLDVVNDHGYTSLTLAEVVCSAQPARQPRPTDTSPSELPA